MKKLYHSASLLLLVPVILLAGCSGNKTEAKKEQEVVQEVKKPVIIGNETSLLLKDLAENGDYVNSNVFPSLIKASVVHECLDKNIHVIDLRASDKYSKGHIKGSVSKKFE